MGGPGLPSLDQLRVFLTVVETGSFAAAGRRLMRATSAVSYSVANLERQLGVALFDRERTKKPMLTEAGIAVLSEAKTLSTGIDNLRAKVSGLMAGFETEVALVVDVMMPTSRLVDAMHAFEEEFPTVTLRLHVEALGAVTQLVQSGVANIGISGPLNIMFRESSASSSAVWNSFRWRRRAIHWHPVPRTRRELRENMCSSFSPIAQH